MKIAVYLFLVFGFFAAPSSLLAAGATQAPLRIVSTSLCSDSYVLDAQLKPASITALSWQSRGDLSMAPQSPRARPLARDDAETLLSLNPTHVIFGPGEGGHSAAILDAAGIKHMALKWGESFETYDDNEFTLRTFLGLPNFRKEPRGFIPNDDGPLVLYLSRSGGTAGSDTFVDAVITAAGGRNIITESRWRPAELETLITLKPDLIITSFFENGSESAQSKGVRNRALQNLIAETPHVNVPGKYWPCAGPGLGDARNIIAAAIKALP
ncbi:MAG: hypothetical protein V3U82_06835 [Robiginitomaculum sp.]